MNNQKSNPLNILIAAGVILVALQFCSLLPKPKPASDQDLNCRQIGREGREAKSQAEYDYAKEKFGKSCDGWIDPNLATK